MRQIKVECKSGERLENVYSIEELSYLGKLLSCKDSYKKDYQHKRTIRYLEIPCAFDIETTNIYTKKEDGTPETEPRPFAFMYHWQFCLDDQVVFGRTWEEFQKLLETLEKRMNLNATNRLVVWVHNLSFEWAFFHDFIEYEEGFFKEERSPLKIVTKGGIEFRDSYALSNMTLQKFCENETGVIHYKLEGDTFNYDKIRTPLTRLDEYEEAYCYNDVRGLCECILSRLKDDTLASIPMTSTGYVRRDLRNNMRTNKKNRKAFLNSKLSPELYTFCREAFRGGDTHANSDRANQINRDGWGEDIKSSYPAGVVIFDRYPISAFFPIKESTFLNNDMSEYALLLRVRFRRLRYDIKGKYYCGVPYIPIAKCSAYAGKKIIDNGRIIYADYIEMCITNLDFDIIKREYIWDDICYGEIYASRGDKLPKEIRDTTMDYFRKKTLLDGDPAHEYEYMKAKNKLNSIYGCMVMRMDHDIITWDPKKRIYVPEGGTLQDQINKYYNSRNSFLSYQHGLFITAYARMRLREMLWTVGRDVIYCDTDSIKGVGDHLAQFEKKNEELKKLAIDNGAYAEDKKGNCYYLGVWENETAKGRYDEFKTLGAKKYVYRIGDEIKSTIAGVNKKAGKEYFTKYGVDGLKIGARITNSGHLTAFYNDDEIHEIKINGARFTTGSNVALVNNSYTIGVTGDYADLLCKTIAGILDFD